MNRHPTGMPASLGSALTRSLCADWSAAATISASIPITNMQLGELAAEEQVHRLNNLGDLRWRAAIEIVDEDDDRLPHKCPRFRVRLRGDAVEHAPQVGFDLVDEAELL